VPNSQPNDSDRRLRRLQRALLIALDARASLLSRGEIPAAQFSREAQELLAGAHSRAAELGAEKAGGAVTRAQEAMIGRRQAEAQQTFLQGYLQDLARGRYLPKAQGGEGAKVRRARSILYALRLTGTANAAWTAAIAAAASDSAGAIVFGAEQRGEVETLWELGSAERHCAECPQEAARGWVPISQRSRMPGDGSTSCISRCKCTLVTRDGQRSFSNG